MSSGLNDSKEKNKEKRHLGQFKILLIFLRQFYRSIQILNVFYLYFFRN